MGPMIPMLGNVSGLLRSAGRKLRDVRNSALSLDSRLILAYDAAHSLAVAAQQEFRPGSLFSTTIKSPSTRLWRFKMHRHQIARDAYDKVLSLA